MDTNIILMTEERLREIIESSVQGCVGKLLMEISPKRESESVDINGALEYLNSNGYKIAKGQIYKETSSGTIPYKRFGNKLHFKISELRAWAEMKLVDCNTIGRLDRRTS